MNTSALPPASIWRASIELEAKESLTRTPELRVHESDNSPTTLVSDEAANTSSAGCFDCWAPAGNASSASTMMERTRRRRSFIVCRGLGELSLYKLEHSESRATRAARQRRC